MTWIKLDDGFVENPKVGALSDRAFRLHVAALCYAGKHLTNGVISTKTSEKLALLIDLRRRNRILTELEQAGLWLPIERGWEVKDYLQYNLSKEEVEAERAKARERMRLRRTGVPPNSSPEVQPNVRQNRSPERSGTHARGALDPEETSPKKVSSGVTVSEEAPPTASLDVPPTANGEVDLSEWQDALRYVRDGGWRLDQPLLCGKLLHEFGCNDPNALMGLCRVGRELTEARG